MKKITLFLMGGVILFLSSCTNDLKQDKVEDKTIYAVYQDTVVKMFRATDGAELDINPQMMKLEDINHFGASAQIVGDIVKEKGSHRYVENKKDDTHDISFGGTMIYTIIVLLIGIMMGVLLND